jgi:hypothetical protein
VGEIQLNPPVKNWLDEIHTLINYNVEELAFVPCFAANEIGSAREDGKVKIFEGHTDPFI